ncbi:class I SAM-dependent DNA methyltransferase [uncultured Sulfitobacter sp.]|jgi:predicted TPR repeat methyltransferase|uniref:class I SAM-dependent DNA methyltransferase n=1 Tax=Sulfitobacter sp. SH22 TaxID=3421172 RepID=UPI0025CC67EB|nr:class I SAM-dependent methyltransferase [uncultured Sulfitobacter sp.]
MGPSNENLEMLAQSYKAETREDLTLVYDQWAASYDAHASERKSAQPGAVARVSLELITNKDASILDVGAGTGLIGETLRRGGLHNLAALDPSEKMLAVARAKGIYQSYHQNYLGDRLPFKAGAFDAIVASGIFTTGHVNASVFPELNRLLKTSGKVIFSLNTKLLSDAGFKRLLEQSEGLNWYVERVGKEFDMMDSRYSTAKAVVVALRKLA